MAKILENTNILLIFAGFLFIFNLATEATTQMTTPTDHDQHGQTPDQLSPQKVCCNIINEADIDLKFFAELCKSVIEREMATEAGIRKYRQGKYPPPGMMERCRKKILELCGIDISPALLENTAEKMSITTDSKRKLHQTSPRELNITECLNDSHLELTPVTTGRKFPNKTTLPSYMHQERPLYLGFPPVNLALMEKGSPYPELTKYKSKHADSSSLPRYSKSRQNTAVLSYLKEDKGPESKGVPIIEPIYKLSITIFFIFTMTKLIMKKPSDAEETVPQLVEVSYLHHNGYPTHEAIVSNEEKQLDDISWRLETSEAADEMETACEELTEHLDEIEEDNLDVDKQEEAEEQPVVSEEQNALTELANQIRHLMEVDDAKIAVLGMEVQAEFPTVVSSTAQDCEVLVKPDDDVEGEQDRMDEQKPVVVTGKMIISLLGKENALQQLLTNEMGSQPQLIVVGSVDTNIDHV